MLLNQDGFERESPETNFQTITSSSQFEKVANCPEARCGTLELFEKSIDWVSAPSTHPVSLPPIVLPIRGSIKLMIISMTYT